MMNSPTGSGSCRGTITQNNIFNVLDLKCLDETSGKDNTLRTEAKLAEIKPLASLMTGHLFTALAKRFSTDEAAELLFSAGVECGEEDALIYFNLEDSPELFINKFRGFCSRNNYQNWGACKIEPEIGRVELEFDVAERCNRRNTKKWFLECQFLQGYFKGILECYTNKVYEVDACCGKICSQCKDQRFKTCCYRFILCS